MLRNHGYYFLNESQLIPSQLLLLPFGVHHVATKKDDVTPALPEASTSRVPQLSLPTGTSSFPQL